MKHNLSYELLREIAHVDEWPCVSLYMPVTTPSVKKPRTQENMIRLKNMERRAAQELEAAGIENPGDFVAPLRNAREAEQPLWSPKAKGFAGFISPGYSRFVSLPIDPGERTDVEHRFTVKPLVQALSEPNEFLVLSLDQKHVRLLEGDALSLDVADTGDRLPSMPEIVAEYDFERDLNAAPGARTNVRFGPGPEEDTKAHILEFLERLDEAVNEEIGEHSPPIVLAGVEYLVGHYRKLSKLPRLAEGFVRGNPSTFRQGELHRRAWEIVRREHDAEINLALRKLERAPRDHRILGIEHVLPAACEGRIYALYLDPQAELRGHFDPQGEAVRVDEDEGQTDLLDTAAVLGARTGAHIYTVDPSRLPASEPAAGLHR
ncbi:MAG: hypothetical protein ACOCWU_02570 [Spirochaetota bacterium]